jgi:hypothetical protein
MPQLEVEQLTQKSHPPCVTISPPQSTQNFRPQSPQRNTFRPSINIPPHGHCMSTISSIIISQPFSDTDSSTDI